MQSTLSFFWAGPAAAVALLLFCCYLLQLGWLFLRALVEFRRRRGLLQFQWLRNCSAVLREDGTDLRLRWPWP